VPKIAGELDPDGVFRPYIRIEVSIPNFGMVRTRAMVDSGADHATLSISLLEPLGLTFQGLIEDGTTRGAGGEVEQRECIGEIRWKSKLFAKRFKVIEKLPIPVVGRSDFFAKYTVDFAGWMGDQPFMMIERR